MAKRQDADLVSDIQEAIGRIRHYTQGLSYEAFLVDTKTQDAVVRNLEIVGEAVKSLSAGFKKRHEDVNWKDVAAMRDRLIHHYFGVNWAIVWDVVTAKLAELSRHLETRSNGGSP